MNSDHGPPERREPPAATCRRGPNSVLADDKPTLNHATVIRLRRVDPRRRRDLHCALDAVPLTVGFAAWTAQVLLEYECGPRLAARRLEALRRQWHRDVDQAITRALEQVRAS